MHAIILAAGLATRSGGEKLFWEYGGKPLVALAVEAALGAGLVPAVVCGFQKERIHSALLPYRDIRFIENREYEEGQFTSIQAGVRAVPPGEDFFISLADMPMIRSDHYRELVSSYQHEMAGIRPLVNGVVGHPVLLESKLASVILDADPHSRMKEILSHYPIQLKKSADTSYVTDVDTLSAYQELIRR